MAARLLLALVGVALNAALGAVPPQSEYDLPQCDRDCFEWWYLRGPDFFLAFQNVLGSGGKTTHLEAGDFKTMRQFSATHPYARPAGRNVMSSTKSSRFSREGTSGSIRAAEGTVEWDIKVTGDWYFRPMGPLLESVAPTIFWDVTKAVARLTGWISFGGDRRELREAPGYEDHNWGNLFPEWWTWFQASDFEDCPFPTGVVAGGGKPRHAFLPVAEEISLGAHYRDAGGKWERLAISTVKSHRVTFDMAFPKFRASGEDGEGRRIEVWAEAPADSFLDLRLRQTDTADPFHDSESLKARLSFRVSQKTGDSFRTLAECRSRPTAGIEYGTRSAQKRFPELHYPPAAR